MQIAIGSTSTYEEEYEQAAQDLDTDLHIAANDSDPNTSTEDNSTWYDDIKAMVSED